MTILYLISTLILLGILAFQDFKERKISAFLLPILFFSLVLNGAGALDLKELAGYFLVNLSFIVLQVGILTIYFSLKNKKLINIVNQYIGIGDLLFFVVLCAAFSPVNFILFYCGALFLSIIFVAVYRFIIRREMKEIPLAGIFALTFIALVIPRLSEGSLFYNDQHLLRILL